jgi:uncharacterized protein (UPF0261 family)
MSKVVAVLATVDTKGPEAQFLREEIEALGGKTLLINLGVMGKPTVPVDVSTDEVLKAGGSSLDEILKNPSRQAAAPHIVAGAQKILKQRVQAGEVHAVVGLGGTQGTSTCCQVMQSLPYGFPKLMLSTVASGDTSPFVDIKDITMMFSVSDILGLNPLSRKMLSNAASAAWGMANNTRTLEPSRSTRGVIGMTNLGVLTAGANHAIDLFHQEGYEVITFHAVGSGGRAMEQLIKEGAITAVFDYALGEISDEVFGGLRAANAERLTVAGKLGVPQVICPGGTEHLGLFVDVPNQAPEAYRDHKYTFHSPRIFSPRLNGEEIRKVALTITDRLKHSKSHTVFMIPKQGVSRYSISGAVLEDPESDAAFFDALRTNMPSQVVVEELDLAAEDPAFVEAAVKTLIGLIRSKERSVA